MSKPQLIICGSIAIDRIMNFSGKYRDLIKPDKIHVLSLSMLIDKLEDTKGGIGANIAYNLAMLDEKPILLGSVGKNAAAYLKSLAKVGVDTTHLHISKLPTASFTVITDSEDNQVGGFYQGAMADSESVSFTPWEGQNVLAVVSAYNPEAMARQVQECHDHDMRMVYDPGQQVNTLPAHELKAAVDTAEILIANDYEMSVLGDKLDLTAEQLKAQVPLAITTFGSKGSVIEGTKAPTPIYIDIAKPDAVLDPTGAGDAYRAGFLYGILREWDLRVCGQMGAVAASFAVEKHGTQKHKFTKAEFAKRYKANFKEEVSL